MAFGDHIQPIPGPVANLLDTCGLLDVMSDLPGSPDKLCQHLQLMPTTSTLRVAAENAATAFRTKRPTGRLLRPATSRAPPQPSEIVPMP